MTIFVLFIISALAWMLYHSATIAQQAQKELIRVYEELKKTKEQVEEITQAYRDVLESLNECKKEHDHEDPEYH